MLSKARSKAAPKKSTPKAKPTRASKLVTPKAKPTGASKATPKAKPSARSQTAAAPTSASAADWRQDTLERMRQLIFAADPEMVEERKWIKPTKPAGVPVWSHAGIVCTGEIYQKIVKLTFMYGASLSDPKRLFNSSLEGGTRRAIDIPEGAAVDAGAFKALIKAAVAFNTAKKQR